MKYFLLKLLFLIVCCFFTLVLGSCLETEHFSPTFWGTFYKMFLHTAFLISLGVSTVVGVSLGLMLTEG